MKLIPAVLGIVLFLHSFAFANIVEDAVEYKHKDTVLEGFIVYDNSIKKPMPVVVIVHQWKGLSENEKMRARMFAKLGYVAFAADIYGKGVRPVDRKEAGETAGIYRADRKLLVERVRAALEKARSYPMSDKMKTAAVGYCFGGTAVLELARAGNDALGVISFHGNLDTPNPAVKKIKAKIQVHNGALDKAVPHNVIMDFEKEMNAAHADWHLVNYSGAVHSFTQKESGNDITTNSAYNAAADRRSWGYAVKFLEEIFAL